MKKLNFKKIFYSLASSFLIFVGVAALTGCNSLPVGNHVNAVELLDGNSDVYIAIPKSVDTEFVRMIIRKSIPGITESQMNQICDRTAKIYCGISGSSGEFGLQASVEGEIPTSLIPIMLSEKKGWSSRSVTTEGAFFSHEVYSANGIDLAFPSNGIVCVGRGIEEMINKYDYLAYDSILPVPGINLEFVDAPDNKYLPGEVYNYLGGDDSSIRFYANNPLYLITSLLGLKLDLNVVNGRGAFSVSDRNPNKYLLEIFLDFESEKFLKAGKALLRLFGVDVSQDGSNTLQIKGIEIEKKDLYGLLNF